MELRPIRNEEKVLIQFLIQMAGFSQTAFEIASHVNEYEGGIMGSIGIGNESAEYAGDLIQVKYNDEDNVPVIITLTIDKESNLLDLDFWKEDFSKLLQYPKPDQVVVIS